jgi:hypothetical protein
MLQSRSAITLLYRMQPFMLIAGLPWEEITAPSQKAA